MEFYDSSRWPLIPHDGDAALYRDGDFAAPADVPDRLQLEHHRWITVNADYRTSSIQDVLEQPWYSPSMVRAFVRGRTALGMEAIEYTDRAQAAEAIAALRDFGNGDLLTEPNLFWWIATLDGLTWTAEDLAADLAARWRAPEITADRIWAVQHTDLGTYDQSTLFRTW